MTYNVFSGTLNPTQSKPDMHAVEGSIHTVHGPATRTVFTGGQTRVRVVHELGQPAGWVGSGRNFPPFDGLCWVVFSVGKLQKTKLFIMLPIHRVTVT